MDNTRKHGHVRPTHLLTHPIDTGHQQAPSAVLGVTSSAAAPPPSLPKTPSQTRLRMDHSPVSANGAQKWRDKAAAVLALHTHSPRLVSTTGAVASTSALWPKRPVGKTFNGLSLFSRSSGQTLCDSANILGAPNTSGNHLPTAPAKDGQGAAHPQAEPTTGRPWATDADQQGRGSPRARPAAPRAPHRPRTASHPGSRLISGPARQPELTQRHPRGRLAPRPRSCYATAQGPRQSCPAEGLQDPRARAGSGAAGRESLGEGARPALACGCGEAGAWGARGPGTESGFTRPQASGVTGSLGRGGLGRRRGAGWRGARESGEVGRHVWEA